MLVHVPYAYQNRIQGMIGSFAYIGVTFFFMTSSYGLALSLTKKPEKIKHFWRYSNTTWCPECFGFIWGILLALYSNKFYEYFRNGWLLKLFITFVVAIAFGGLYLKFKRIPITGDYVLKILLGIAIIVFVLVSNVRLSYGNKISLFIGGISFEVYLLHIYVYQIVVYCFGGNLSSGQFIVICMVITLALAYVLHLLTAFLVEKVYSTKLFAKVK